MPWRGFVSQNFPTDDTRLTNPVIDSGLANLYFPFYAPATLISRTLPISDTVLEIYDNTQMNRSCRKGQWGENSISLWDLSQSERILAPITEHTRAQRLRQQSLETHSLQPRNKNVLNAHQMFFYHHHYHHLRRRHCVPRRQTWATLLVFWPSVLNPFYQHVYLEDWFTRINRSFIADKPIRTVRCTILNSRVGLFLKRLKTEKNNTE